MSKDPYSNSDLNRMCHALQERLQLSTRMSQDLANLSRELALKLELCAIVMETCLSQSGTEFLESSLTATMASDWRTPGPKDTKATLTKKLNHALTELRISREQQPANDSQDSIPSLAEAVRILDESNRRSAWGETREIQHKPAQQRIFLAKKLKRKRKKT